MAEVQIVGVKVKKGRIRYNPRSSFLDGRQIIFAREAENKFMFKLRTIAVFNETQLETILEFLKSFHFNVGEVPHERPEKLIIYTINFDAQTSIKHGVGSIEIIRCTSLGSFVEAASH